ncbi:hypothetical protein ACFVHS_14835 [Streptomyces sp. NPDC057746]|uniref:hypothetical protein n=1 Tax=Streptomyces sp. NPDC057746 TaxID=3346237 RepID=UPI0036C0DEB3
MELLDLVVPVREGAVNQQLRYALRSWEANLLHRRVWIIGYRPPWLGGVGFISTRQTGRTKYANTTLAMRQACTNPEISDPFLYANDDLFVMEPLDAMPVLHRGPVSRVEAYYASRASGQYLRGMRETRDLLVQHGHEDPLSYELHVPLPVSKAGMLHALDTGRHLDVIHKRTAYGNLSQIGGVRIADVKVLHRGPRFDRSTPFLSTMPDSFTNGEVGRLIRTSFPKASSYETTRRS